MIKLRLVGLVICPAFVAHSYGHEPGASPTPTPAVYQNATAATYAGSAPNNGLKAPTGNPSPTKGTWPKASSRTVSPPSSGIVGPPAPNLVKAVASSQPKLQKLRADAGPPPTAVNAAASTQPKLLKAMASTSSEFVRPLPNSSGTKSP